MHNLSDPRNQRTEFGVIMAVEVRGEFQKGESERGKWSECMGQIPAKDKVNDLRFELPSEKSLQCVQPR